MKMQKTSAGKQWFDELPVMAQDYVKRLSDLVNTEVSVVLDARRHHRFAQLSPRILVQAKLDFHFQSFLIQIHPLLSLSWTMRKFWGGDSDSRLLNFVFDASSLCSLQKTICIAVQL